MPHTDADAWAIIKRASAIQPGDWLYIPSHVADPPRFAEVARVTPIDGGLLRIYVEGFTHRFVFYPGELVITEDVLPF